MAVVIVVVIPSLTWLTYTAGHPCRTNTTTQRNAERMTLNHTKSEFGLKTRTNQITSFFWLNENIFSFALEKIQDDREKMCKKTMKVILKMC